MINKIFKDKDASSKHKHKVHKKARRLIIPKKYVIIRFIYQNTAIIIGSAVAALGFVLFQLPFDIVAGGVTGLAIIINEFTPIPAGSSYFIMNIPLMVLGYYSLGKWRFISSTLISVIAFSIFTDIFLSVLPEVMKEYPVSKDLLLNSIYGGIIFGLGVGVIYRFGGTIGGTGIPARILQKKWGFPLSQSYMYTDIAIIILAGFVFNWENALLGTLTLLIGGMTSDFVLEGSSQVRTAMIITDHPKILGNTLMNELERGVTKWTVQGGYTNEDKAMIYCTVRRSQVADLKYLVSAVDSNAFLVIGTAQQAWGGRGFTHLKPPKNND
jgi:uncharacterized membrane-anchored protein YitT (DUF2179 family)